MSGVAMKFAGIVDGDFDHWWSGCWILDAGYWMFNLQIPMISFQSRIISGPSCKQAGNAVASDTDALQFFICSVLPASPSVLICGENWLFLDFIAVPRE